MVEVIIDVVNYKNQCASLSTKGAKWRPDH